MKTRLLSVLLVFLLITAAAIPAVSADPAPLIAAAAPAAPATAEMIIGGITVVMTGAAALKIAENIGKTWDNTLKGWDQLMKDTGAALDNLIHAKKWIGITTKEGQAVMAAVYEYNAAAGGKKDGKWYFEARKNHGKIEINPERMDETQAVREMGRGKDIMTLNKELAQNVVGRFKGLSKKEIESIAFEGDHNPAKELFHHLHYEAKGMRLHCWSWK